MSAPNIQFPGAVVRWLFAAQMVVVSVAALRGADSTDIAFTTNQSAVSDPKGVIVHLKQEWQARRVESLLITHVDSSRIFRVEWTPERLDTEAPFTMFLRYPVEREMPKKLEALVEKLPVQSSPEKQVYVRWGFVFMNGSGARIFSIYLDRYGHDAILNGHPVKLESNELFNWAEETFKQVFE